MGSHGLTLLGSGRAWRHFLVRINGGLRRQTVKLFPAYQVDLLEVLHLLLSKRRQTRTQPLNITVSHNHTGEKNKLFPKTKTDWSCYKNMLSEV